MGNGVSKLSPKARRRRRAKEIVDEIREGKEGPVKQYEDAKSGNRRERRRFVKASRVYDKIHGEGAADRDLRAALEGEPDALASKFVRR